MTLAHYTQFMTDVAYMARGLTEAVHYSLEPVEKTDAPITSRINTLTKCAILTLELVKLAPLDLETKRQLVTIEALLRLTKATIDSKMNPSSLFKDPAIGSELMALIRNRAELDLIVSNIYEKSSLEELTAKGWPSSPKAIEEVCFAAQYAPIGLAVAGGAETTLRALAICSELTKVEEVTPIPATLTETGPESLFDFLSFNTIPEELHNDPILSQYRDSISWAPIRFAMTHRRHPQVIYEKASMQALINRELARGVEPRCPLTQDIITPNDLIPSLATQTIINNRLRKLSTLLKSQYAINLKAATAAAPI